MPLKWPFNNYYTQRTVHSHELSLYIVGVQSARRETTLSHTLCRTMDRKPFFIISVNSIITWKWNNGIAADIMRSKIDPTYSIYITPTPPQLLVTGR